MIAPVGVPSAERGILISNPVVTPLEPPASLSVGPPVAELSITSAAPESVTVAVFAFPEPLTLQPAIAVVTGVGATPDVPKVSRSA